MPSMRCSLCDINYPWDREVCQVCGEPLWFVKNEKHDTDWRSQAEDKKNHSMPRRLPDLDAPVVEKDGFCFVADEVLRELGISELETNDIIKIRGKFYEVQASRLDTEVPCWWIELVESNWDYDEYPVMTDEEYRRMRRGQSE